MSLRNIFKRHRNSVTELRQDAASETLRLQEKVTRLTVELEMERSMRCDAITFANSVKEHRSSSDLINLNDDELDDGSDPNLLLTADNNDTQEGSDGEGGSSATAAAAAADWKKKLRKSKRALAFVQDTHGIDETAEELERLIMEKYEKEQQLRIDLAERDGDLRKLKAKVNAQELKIAALTKELEKAGTCNNNKKSG